MKLSDLLQLISHSRLCYNPDTIILKFPDEIIRL
jgi:hypothetical protein